MRQDHIVRPVPYPPGHSSGLWLETQKWECRGPLTSSTKSPAMASAPDRCFKSHDLPEEYQRGRHRIGEAPADPDLSNDSGSDTDDSVDTESDRENVQLPIFRASDSACTGPTSPERDPYGHPGFGNGGQCQVVLWKWWKFRPGTPG